MGKKKEDENHEKKKKMKKKKITTIKEIETPRKKYKTLLPLTKAIRELPRCKREVLAGNGACVQCLTLLPRSFDFREIGIHLLIRVGSPVIISVEQNDPS